MVLQEERSQDCGWNHEDSVGQVTLGGRGHSLESCLQACLDSEYCIWATANAQGICHLYATCDGSIGSGYSVYVKECKRD